MDFTILVFAVLAILLMYAAAHILLPVNKVPEIAEHKDKTLRIASALVINTTMTDRRSRDTLMLLEVEVFPPKQHPFKAELNGYFSARQIARLTPDAVVKVKYDPTNPSKVVFVDFAPSDNFYSTL
ncbi:hypothetical protein [Candidatus Chlorohelix sp.]|uniref:hypothetical protein n=1 Tax=Candidatus Chlorohelix sp. TaxID=3139201 RepID=UPI00305BFA9C